MFQKILYAISLLLLLMGCKDRYSDYFPYQDDGLRKPHIAFLPLLDSSESFSNDSLSEELTRIAYQHMMYNGDLYLFPEKQVERFQDSCGAEANYFGRDLSFANNFEGADFVVATELIEHKIVPRDQVKIKSRLPCGPSVCFISMKLRIRVIDTRCKTPRVALQEIIETTHPTTLNEACNPLNSNTCGEAHQRLIDQLILRLQQAVGSSP